MNMPEGLPAPVVESPVLELISALVLAIFICLAFLFLYLFVTTALTAYHDREIPKTKIANLIVLLFGTVLLILLAFLTLPQHFTDEDDKIARKTKLKAVEQAKPDEEPDPLLSLPSPAESIPDVELDLYSPGTSVPPAPPYSY